MRKVTLFDKFKYWFDNLMAKGAIVLILWLMLISLLVVLVFSASMELTAQVLEDSRGDQGSFSDLFWMNLSTVLEPGLAEGGSWTFKLENFTVAMMGILLVSTLIGLITAGIEERLQQLRKGRSVVLEQNHTIILGWSSQIFTVVAELVVANANQRRPVIAILGDADKVEMEDQLREQVKDLKNTRLVIRSGSATEPNDLDLVNPYSARSIILLPPETDSPDSAVLKTLLALTKNLPPTQHTCQIVTSLQDVRNRSVAKMIGKDKVTVVMVNDLLARLTVQTSLQPGLSSVYTELFDFDGDEIYFKAEPGLTGKTFADALFAYADSTAIGLHKAHGPTLLNPPLTTPIEAGDRLAVISADDDTIRLTEMPPRQSPKTPSSPRPTAAASNSARSCSWAGTTAPPSSWPSSDAMSQPALPSQWSTKWRKRSGAKKFSGKNLPTCRSTTKAAIPPAARCWKAWTSLPTPKFSCSAAQTCAAFQEADERTLVTLLHLRNLCEQLHCTVSITSEMMDTRNRKLAAVTQTDDFVVSQQMVSLLLAQISENPQLNDLFDDLLDVDGSEIYLKPIGEYVHTQQPLNFYTLVEAARRHNETAIGYRLMRHSSNPERQYGVQLNPNKTEKIQFTPDDFLIVLAED
ncbi:MAG: CASTOR/POLLUX-related putative ion channel [Caldilinea sp.]